MTLQRALQRLSNSKLDEQGAANKWAGTKGLELLGALNAKAGSRGLGLNAAIRRITGGKGEGLAELSRSSPFNVALHKKVTITSGAFGEEHRVTNGRSSITNEFAQSQATGAQTCIIDLNGSFPVTGVRVWHFYGDGRSYNSKLEVSGDGTTWTTVFDSAASGTYAESSSGRLHSLSGVNVSHVRETLNGSTANTSNHWVEIEVLSSGYSAGGASLPLVFNLGYQP